jgi:hydrogenase large subunit
MIGAQYVHDHVMHFYHLHALDWVDVVSALSADPKATAELAQSLSHPGRTPRPATSPTCKKKLKGFVEGGQLGIFANGYWGHPAYKLPPEANLMAVAHYLEASPGSATWSSCMPSSAARTRTRTSSSAACPARST